MLVRVPTPRRPVAAVNLALALLVVAGGTGAYLTVRGEPSANAGENAGVRTVAVREGTVTKTVTAAGSVASAATASASFATSGTITSIAVAVGQKVAKGRVLAKVDPAAARRGLNTAEANRAAAGDALDRAQDADTDTTDAENEVTQADLAVAEAKATLDGTTLKAPMAGTVVAINGTIGGSSGGSTSSAGSGSGSTAGAQQSATSSTSSSGFIDLADLTKLKVTAQVGEADATKLKARQQATVTWNALQGATATGTVQAIDPQATTTNNVVTYGVSVAITKLPVGAKPGQTVSVSVVTGTVADAIQVNSVAVRGTGNRHSVTVLVNGKQETRQVEVGLQGDTAYEITAGLQAGEQVVIPESSTSTGAGNRAGFPGGGGLSGGGGFPGGGGAPGGGAPGGGQRGGGAGR